MLYRNSKLQDKQGQSIHTQQILAAEYMTEYDDLVRWGKVVAACETNNILATTPMVMVSVHWTPFNSYAVL